MKISTIVAVVGGAIISGSCIIGASFYTANHLRAQDRQNRLYRVHLVRPDGEVQRIFSVESPGRPQLQAHTQSMLSLGGAVDSRTGETVLAPVGWYLEVQEH